MTRTHGQGFTLIELMIVIGVIMLLAAVLIVGFSGAFGKRDKAQATATITTLKSNIESFQSRWGAPPPCTFQDLGAMTGALNLMDNEANRGIETLVLALRSGRENGPYLDKTLLGEAGKRGNLDNDTFLATAMAPHALAMPDDSSDELFEILDPWGNPFAYVTIAAVRAGTVSDKIQLANGETVEIKALECQDMLRHPVTHDYPASYALWSFGEDGKNDYGRGDDITSWPKYEE